MTRTAPLLRAGLAAGAALALLGACSIPGPPLPPFLYVEGPVQLVLAPTAPGGPQSGVAIVTVENHTDTTLTGPVTASGTTNRSGWTVSVQPGSPCLTLPGGSLADEGTCDLYVTVTAPAATLPDNVGSANVEVLWGGFDADDSFNLSATL